MPYTVPAGQNSDSGNQFALKVQFGHVPSRSQFWSRLPGSDVPLLVITAFSLPASTLGKMKTGSLPCSPWGS